MAAYATYEDVQARMSRTLSEDEQALASTLLDDAAVIIDSFNENADSDKKLVVSCRMVIRALGDGQSSGVPIGADMEYIDSLTLQRALTDRKEV